MSKTVCKKCMICQKDTCMNISDETYEDYLKYEKGAIDNIARIRMKNITDPKKRAELREFLMTGMCLDCQNRIFKPLDEDEEEEES